MTCLEKLKKEHPEDIASNGKPLYCPSIYGYAERPNFCCDDSYADMYKRCETCWNRECVENSEDPVESTPRILDSGNRREFGTGAVRDIQEGKGRCDLMPLDVIGKFVTQNFEGTYAHRVFEFIDRFQESGDEKFLGEALGFATSIFGELETDKAVATMFLEVAKHFEEGAKKYGENNWQNGIPVHCYIDSAVRHYLKYLRGDKDEPHDRAFCWNIMCAIWTCIHKPELNSYAPKDEYADYMRKYDPVQKAYDILVNYRDKNSPIDLDMVIGYLGEALDD